MIASQESHLESLHIGRSGCTLRSTTTDLFLSLGTSSAGNSLLLDTGGLFPEQPNNVGESSAGKGCGPAKEGLDQAFRYDGDFHEDTYICPICDQHFDLFSFYLHIDSEHLLENCPICLIAIQKDIAQHILEQHGHTVTVEGRGNSSEDPSKACLLFQGEAPEHGQPPLDGQGLHLKGLNENIGVRYYQKEEAVVRAFQHDDDDFQDEGYFCPSCNQGFDLLVFFFHIYDEHLQEDCPLCAATVDDIAEHLLEHESVLTIRSMKKAIRNYSKTPIRSTRY